MKEEYKKKTQKFEEKSNIIKGLISRLKNDDYCIKSLDIDLDGFDWMKVALYDHILKELSITEGKNCYVVIYKIDGVKYGYSCKTLEEVSTQLHSFLDWIKKKELHRREMLAMIDSLQERISVI